MCVRCVTLRCVLRWAPDKFVSTHKKDILQFPYCMITNKLTLQLTYASIPFSLCHLNVCPQRLFYRHAMKAVIWLFFPPLT